MPITQRQAMNLANHLADLRAGWTVPSLVKVMENQREHPASFADIAHALCAAARDPKCLTPQLAFVDPRFWPTTAAAKPKGVRCPAHPDDPSGNSAHCQGCWSEIKTGMRPRDMLGKRYEPLDGP